ncbi:MAG: hypothetical protein ACE10A_13900 [Acidiferrobacterales bacterium]
MAKNRFQYEKQRRDAAKKKKQEEKRQRKLAKNDTQENPDRSPDEGEAI